MRRGDIVRLLHPLKIHTDGFEEFTHGVIAARIKAEKIPQEQGNASFNKATIKELIIYLYNPETYRICLDEEGVPILFNLRLDEVELFKAIKKHSKEIQSDENF